MFIDPTMNPKACAPAERDVSGNRTRDRLYVSFLWSEEESLGGQTYYEHYVPTGRGKVIRKILLDKTAEIGSELHLKGMIP